MKKVEKGDDVLVRGEVIWIDDNGIVRVRFPGYQYPITIDPEQIEQVIKMPKERIKKVFDNPPQRAPRKQKSRPTD